MQKYFKEIFLKFLILVLTLSGFNYVPVRAEDNMDEGDFHAEEIDLEKYGIESLKDKAKKHKFLDVFEGDPRDNISVVVELEDDPTIDTQIKSGQSAFRSVVNLEAITKKLEAKQTKLAQTIKAIDEDSHVKESFTYLSNSMVMDLKAEKFDEVKELPGVKRIFVEREYYIPEPQMSSSNDIVNAPYTWDELGYKGEGMNVAVLDTGLDTDHPAFNVEPSTDDSSFTKEEFTSFVNENKEAFNAKFEDGGELFNNLKVPFTYDYAEEKISVKPNQDNHSDVNHGTHVAGTVGGNDGNEFKGVAPEAQLMIFKVFNDQGTGATDSVIMSALEDAVVLGVDAINMSLGSDAGFTSEADDFTDDLYKRVNGAGILLSASAGNAHSNAVNNTYGLDLTLATDPDHGIIGSPSTYNGPLAIASSENTHMPVNYIEVGENIYTYVSTDNSITTIEGKHDFVFVPGLGEESDFEEVEVENKVAFIERGEISFEDKMLNAEKYKAKAAIIYGTDDTSVNMDVGASTIPSAYITKTAAESIKESEETSLEISAEEIIIENPSANLPSDFSSIGTTNTLNIKPELTAPGGQIYSALPTQGSSNYGLMSGTSMAAPHVAGGTALLKQYIKDQHEDLDSDEILALMDNLLMSTANIIELEEEEYISVREQGAGVMDIKNAINSNAYLSVENKNNGDGTSRPKLELDDNSSGNFTLEFKVTNFGDEVEEFDIDTIVTVPGIGDADFSGDIGVKSFMLDENYVLDAEVSGPETVTVEPNKTEVIEMKLAVSQEAINELSKVFENGFYVEGFVKLTNKIDSHVDLSIPYLGFVGDWEAARIFDYANDNDVEAEEIQTIHPHVLATTIQTDPEDEGTLLNLGTSVFHDNPAEMMADYNRLVLSPNGDGFFDTLDTMILGQLRNAKELNLVLKDDSGKVVYDQSKENAFKSFFHASYAQIVTYTHFTGNNFDAITFENVPDGKYTLSFEADLGYSSGIDDTLSYDIYIDRKEPKLEKVTNKNDELNLELSDDNFLLYTELSIGTFDEDGELVLNQFDSIHTPYGENEKHEFSVDLSKIDLDPGHVFVVTSVDAGYNEIAYLITPETVGEPKNEVWAMEVGEMREITPQEFEFVEPTFEVADEDIVTVDADGNVEAKAVGKTTIQVKDAIGDFTIEVHVVENKGLKFKEKEYTTRVNEAVKLDLLFNDDLLEYNSEDITFDYDKEVFEREGDIFKALEKGTYVVKATYDHQGDIQLQVEEAETEDQNLTEDAEEEIEKEDATEEEKQEVDPADDTEEIESEEPETENDAEEATDLTNVENADDLSEDKEETPTETEENYEATVVIKVRDLDKTTLQLLIDNFKELSEDVYSADSLKKATAAYKRALELLESDSVTQDEIDEASEQLVQALNELKYAVQGLEDNYEITVDQSIQLNPAPVEGTWDYDKNIVTIERHLNGYRLVGLTPGETVITFTNNDGESKDVIITVKEQDSNDKNPAKPEKPEKEDDKGRDGETGGKTTDQGGKGDKDKKTGIGSDKKSKKESNLPKTGTDYSIVTVGILLLGLGLVLFVIHKKKEKST